MIDSLLIFFIGKNVLIVVMNIVKMKTYTMLFKESFIMPFKPIRLSNILFIPILVILINIIDINNVISVTAKFSKYIISFIIEFGIPFDL